MAVFGISVLCPLNRPETCFEEREEVHCWDSLKLATVPAVAAAKWFADLFQDLSQTPTRRHAAGFGGMTAKTDEPTGVNWNGATTNERERVGVGRQGSDLHF